MQYFKKSFSLEWLFYKTIAFILLSVVVGFFIDLSDSKNAKSVLIWCILCAFLMFFAVYLLSAFSFHIVKNLRAAAKKGNLFKQYFADKFFRTAVNNSAACFYVVSNAFINFALSFSGFKWYYLSTAAIFFSIFILKLYLTLNINNDKERQNNVVAAMLIIISVAILSVVITLWENETAFTGKGLIIYWDTLYAFVSLTMVIVNIVRAIKAKNRVLGRFSALGLANALFGMFTLTVSMLMTFSESFAAMKQMALIVGVCVAALVLAVGIAQLVLAKKAAQNPPPSVPDMA